MGHEKKGRDRRLLLLYWRRLVSLIFVFSCRSTEAACLGSSSWCTQLPRLPSPSCTCYSDSSCSYSDSRCQSCSAHQQRPSTSETCGTHSRPRPSPPASQTPS